MGTVKENQQLTALQENLLKEGHTIKVPVRGYSMFPVLRPSDRAVVSPLATASVRPGMIVLFKMNNRFIAHRIIQQTKNRIICKGDSNLQPDAAILEQHIIGVIHSFYRNNRKVELKTNVSTLLCWISKRQFPLFLLKWFYLKSKRLKQKIITKAFIIS